MWQFIPVNCFNAGQPRKQRFYSQNIKATTISSWNESTNLSAKPSKSLFMYINNKLFLILSTCTDISLSHFQVEETVEESENSVL